MHSRAALPVVHQYPLLLTVEPERSELPTHTSLLCLSAMICVAALLMTVSATAPPGCIKQDGIGLPHLPILKRFKNRTLGSNPDLCCAKCIAYKGCEAWNTNINPSDQGPYGCYLRANYTVSAKVSKKECVAGCVGSSCPPQPTPAPPPAPTSPPTFAPPAAGTKPHIVFLLADDYG